MRVADERTARTMKQRSQLSCRRRGGWTGRGDYRRAVDLMAHEVDDYSEVNAGGSVEEV
jgi:hypothetical protein